MGAAPATARVGWKVGDRALHKSNQLDSREVVAVNGATLTIAIGEQRIQVAAGDYDPVPSLQVVLAEHVTDVAFERSLAAMDTAELVGADTIVAGLDQLCEWPLEDAGEECGADRTLFAVGGAVLTPDERLGSVVRRDGTETVVVCALHIAAAITTNDYEGACSVVMPVAEHPLRGRPPVKP